jgi:hypothetical protein
LHILLTFVLLLLLLLLLQPLCGQPLACRYSSSKLAGADLYTAGAAIVWLKQLGPWSDADIADRLIPCYPEVGSSPCRLQCVIGFV